MKCLACDKWLFHLYKGWNRRMGYFLISFWATLALGLRRVAGRDTVREKFLMGGVPDALLGTMMSHVAFEIISCPKL